MVPKYSFITKIKKNFCFFEFKIIKLFILLKTIYIPFYFGSKLYASLTLKRYDLYENKIIIFNL